MNKPSYCIYPKTDNCLDCHLVNYGLDCRNNPVVVEPDENYTPSNWEQAPKHGLGGHALQDIQGFLVAPHVGAWIEIRHIHGIHTYNQSRPMWARGWYGGDNPAANGQGV